MTTLQFSLFFAAILVAYVLVHLRLARFESYLRRIVGLQSLEERIRHLAEVVERVDLDRVEERMAELHADLREMIEGQGRIERAAGGRLGLALDPDTETGRPTGATGSTVGSDVHDALAVLGGAGGGSRSLAVRRAVEAALFATGHRRLKILTDLEQAVAGAENDEVEVVVECEREHMPFKGRVVVRGDAVLDVDLRSAHAMFP